MKRKILLSSVLIGCVVGLAAINLPTHEKESIWEPIPKEEKVEVIPKSNVSITVKDYTEKVEIQIKVGKQAKITIESTPDNIDEELYYDSLEYVAMCVEAEAGNQGRLGKTYVADVILNRFDKGAYNNFYEVIEEENQFECFSNGTINCIPSEETYDVVRNELVNRTNSKIVYFRTNRYSDYGTPAFKYKDHYFSEE